MRCAILLFLFASTLAPAVAQTDGPIPTMDYGFPQKYEIGGITVSGTKTVDPNAVQLFAGLRVGDEIEIPGERISKAIHNLWEQKLFSDVRIDAAEIRGHTIFLNIIVAEKPRLSR
ncbi:MAG TPA: hypothetical protein VKG92_10380, partial [Flavobacteriales bacterium]|nr:hypothetical protein [Flavobacteriales bacterium]